MPRAPGSPTAGRSEADADAAQRLPSFAEDVLEVVAAIPPGRVLTYGDIAELLGRGGPRAVGTVLARYGSGVPWWRVLRAGGLPPRCDEAEALRRYRDEGTVLQGERVDLRQARWRQARVDVHDLPDERPTG